MGSAYWPACRLSFWPAAGLALFLSTSRDAAGVRCCWAASFEERGPAFRPAVALPATGRNFSPISALLLLGDCPLAGAGWAGLRRGDRPCACSPAPHSASMVWLLDGCSAWMSRASPGPPPAAGPARHGSGRGMAQSFRPRLCCEVRRLAPKRPGPDHFASSSSPGAQRRRFQSLADADCPGRFQREWCCCCLRPRLCSGLAVGAPGCGPRCWPPRPRVMAGMGGPYCRARGGGRYAFFHWRFNWRLPLLVGGLPMCFGPWASAHRHHRGAGLAGSLRACCSAGGDFAIRDLASRLQDRSVRQNGHPSPRPGRTG